MEGEGIKTSTSDNDNYNGEKLGNKAAWDHHLIDRDNLACPDRILGFDVSEQKTGNYKFF